MADRAPFDLDDPLPRDRPRLPAAQASGSVVAGTLADLYSLRGYNATHCSGAESISDADVVPTSGDPQLLAAWRALGLSTLDVYAGQRDA